MSYILDALRKSDQQRQRGATPTLMGSQEPAAEPRRFAVLRYGVIAAGLVGAGMVIGWLHPWQSEPTAPARENMVAKPLDSGQKSVSDARTAPGSPGAATTYDKPAPSLSNAGTRGMPAVTAAPTERRASAPAKTVNTGLTDSAPEQRVMTLDELPLSIRQELPSMQISLHLHSTRPMNRFVSINSRMMQEGEDLAPGIRLDEITPEGMIFSYKGYRFRRGVQ